MLSTYTTKKKTIGGWRYTSLVAVSQYSNLSRSLYVMGFNHQYGMKWNNLGEDYELDLIKWMHRFANEMNFKIDGIASYYISITALCHDMLTTYIAANIPCDINVAKHADADLSRPMTDKEIFGNITRRNA
ncbi:cytochrome P450 [Rhizophagus clarus]|uniref:Cytochrome P450 n=1 Tax=Rhizophagus clarus TaxID=94130 RepID=A0A8H3MG10_9GLOM|nr:cytochrome P450 [Rhizophagus clarus]